jgi:hypothetical protein
MPMEGEIKKAQEIPGFVALCQLLSSNGFTIKMGEEGNELLRISQGKEGVLLEIAHKIAHFDVSSLWKTLEDDDRISTLLFLEQLQRVREG